MIGNTYHNKLQGHLMFDNGLLGPILGSIQGSLLGPFLFRIYVNDLPDNLSSDVKLFADGTSLFSVIHDINLSVGEPIGDLKKNQ